MMIKQKASYFHDRQGEKKVAILMATIKALF